jgi:tRNA(fMet)-specific endonuclease VapC
MKYLLDTNICIYIIKKKPAQVFKKLMPLAISDVGISTITLSEMEYGIEKSEMPEKNRIALFEFLTPIEICSFDDLAAKKYGVLRASLERKGKLIGSLDMLIAAHAQSLGLILVTNDEKGFRNISDLKIENWTK